MKTLSLLVFVLMLVACGREEVINKPSCKDVRMIVDYNKVNDGRYCK